MTLRKLDIKNIHKRDPETFKTIYFLNKDKLYNYFLVKVGDVDTAEDLLSETFSSALKSADRLRDATKVSSWLYMIASRRFNDYLRKKYRDRKYYDKVNEKDFIEHDNSAEAITKKEEALIMYSALENLKPQYQQVIKMKYMNDKSIQEIMVELNKSENSIKSLLKRGRKALKDEMIKISDIFNSQGGER